jgi:hypothetical protein
VLDLQATKAFCCMKRLSRKLLFILAAILLLIVIGAVIWQKFKYKIIENSLSAKVAQHTDSLYTVQYDSLSFNEATGDASIKNIRIIPDTSRAKNLSGENMPDFLMDVTIKSLTVTGVKTAKALEGSALQGDSVIIDNPDIILYSLKALQKTTKIQVEANEVYKQILGKLDFIKVGFVFINNLNATGIDFFKKTKNFDFINGKLLLQDILIDSTHHLDTTRILFCRQAAFTVDSFFSYNHNRRELSLKRVHFLGKQKQLLFDQISVDRFENDTSASIRLLDAKGLTLNGVNSNEIVKNKNLVIDTILCNNIILYELPLSALKTSTIEKTKSADSTGFVNVYGVYMKHLDFPKVTFVPFAKSNYSVGNISLEINEVKADQIIELEMHPMDFTKEAQVSLTSLSVKSKDRLYSFNSGNITVNSLHRQLNIQSFDIIPFAGEHEFANKFNYQTDRYDVHLKGISLKNIVMNDLLDNKLTASNLVIENTVAKIYHDLHKPLRQKSKVGNYPSQLLQKMKLPINISTASLKNAYIEYKENETVSDSVGIISFTNSKLNITNITNVPEAIRKNNQLNIAFESNVLNSIPITGNFKFVLNSNDGDFFTNGHTAGFDASILNKVSIPMALIKINSGKINSIDFSFKGNDANAEGDFVMKYDDLKVDVLKRDKNTKEVKKRGFASLAANLVVQNNNPGASGLRKVNAQYKRNIYKSFFNLVWKTVFTGMKETVGIP